MSEINLLQTTDAGVWAKEFMRLHGNKLPDEGLMIAWFANMWAATHDPLTKEIERLTAELFKCRESRLAETMRDLPEWKADKDRIEKLEAALKPFADAIDSDRPDLALTLHDLRMAHEAIAEVDGNE